MSFYRLRASLNKKIIGKYAQVEEALYSCSVWDNPRFIDHEGMHFKKNDSEPITAKAILVNGAKPTDLISTDIIGFTRKLLVSGALKAIINAAKPHGLQFYNSPLIYKSIELNDYWVTNPYIFDFNLIDFDQTKVYLQKDYTIKIEQLSISNFSDFLSEKKRIDQMGYPYSIFIEKPKFLEYANVNFFVIENVEGGIMYVVSEYLKGVIEDARMTGIEFQPTTVSLNEWLEKGGQREKIYGKNV